MQIGASLLGLPLHAFKVSSITTSTIITGTKGATDILNSGQPQTSCEDSCRFNEGGSFTPMPTGMALILLIS